MNKGEKERLTKWCRICGKIFRKRRKSLSDPELRKEIKRFHSTSTLHKTMEVFSEDELENWGTFNYPYDKTQEKPVQDSQTTIDFNSNVLNKKKIRLEKNPVRKYEKRELPWEHN